MNKYPKIHTMFVRDPENKNRIIVGNWSKPEFDYLRDNKWIFTEKVDGTNIRIHWDGEKVLMFGKTDNSQIPVPLIHYLQAAFPPGFCTACRSSRTRVPI